MLPEDAASDFELFARRNPKPCPLLDITEPGSWVTRLAPGADLRTDLPAYRVWEHGTCVAEPGAITPYWQGDLVAFLIGCSFTFDRALLAAGVPVRHVAESLNVPMFITDRGCEPAGRFGGPLVVSMRPIPADLVAAAVAVTSRYQVAHGEPVHIGDPVTLGIADLTKPDFGDSVTIEAGEVPVFWACGVTPQVAIARARLPFAITHAPGHMLITDTPEAEACCSAGSATTGDSTESDRSGAIAGSGGTIASSDGAGWR